MPETDVILTEDKEPSSDDKTCFNVCFDLSMIILGMFVTSGHSKATIPSKLSEGINSEEAI